MDEDWLSAYIEATRPSVWGSREDGDYQARFASIAEALTLSDGASTVQVHAVRSVMYEVSRATLSGGHAVILDLSLMQVMDRLTRLTLSPLNVRQLQFGIAALFANRFASRGRPVEAFYAAEVGTNGRAALPDTSEREDRWFDRAALMQLLFAFAHELAHCDDEAGKALIKLPVDDFWEWWASAMDPYRERLEGQLSSGNLDWLERLPDDGAELLEGGLDGFSAEVRQRTTDQIARGDLHCYWSIEKVMDHLLSDTSGELAREVMCDAAAMLTLMVSAPVEGTSMADRVEACVTASRNLAILRRIEDATSDSTRDSESDARASSDSLVRTRLLLLLGQSMLRGLAFREHGDSSESENAELVSALEALDELHSRSSVLSAAVDLWLPHHASRIATAIARRQPSGARVGIDLPVRIERTTELLRPRRGAVPVRGDADSSADTPLFTVSASELISSRVAPRTPVSVSTTSIPVGAVGRRFGRLLAVGLRDILDGDKALAVLAAAALASSLRLAKTNRESPRVRPVALCSFTDRAELDLLQPIAGGETGVLRIRLLDAIEARRDFIDTAVVVCGGSSNGGVEDSVFLEVWHPGSARITILATYQPSRFGRLRYTNFRVLPQPLDEVLRAHN
ncbi:hypothetical protein ACFVU2_01545 [Leifsonia sp. NPDC058194]|uniref:hypothetical protein n=1 Tax=Leifsonia sp. NPDC058194 TaxID=3346374 RepID=UPI0036DEF588